MSFLAPLYLLGGLAVSLPVLLHLIRRTPRGKQPFSSLMFLTPSPPRITRRSRIEHWFLLLLRAAVILLLAAAFARPFLRASGSLLLDRAPGRQIAILVDTSASMRRGDLFTQARIQAEEVLRELGPNDVVALYQFDSSVRSVVNFPDSTTDRAAHRAIVRQRLKELTPTWQGTDLGRALTTVADTLAASRRQRGDVLPCQMVIISDLQKGSELSALQSFDWPSEVWVTARTVQPAKSTNAALRLLRNTAEPDLRVRVSNAADSVSEEFQIGWREGDEKLMAPASVYVPAGQARVVKIAESPTRTSRLHLTGDAHDFDNDFFAEPVQQREFEVIYLGDDSVEDPRGIRYFLERVWAETPRRKVLIREKSGERPATDPPADLLVSIGVPERHRDAVRLQVANGGFALLLAGDMSSSSTLAEFLPGIDLAEPSDASAQKSEKLASAGRPEFALLTELDFEHPVFAAFVDPRFGDFTKVRFWKHFTFRLGPDANARVLARFDQGGPALWEQPVGKGRVFVLATTWRPADSQLALSSKFVPLLSSLLNQATGQHGETPGDYVVGDEIPVPSLPDAQNGSVTTPQGNRIQLPSGAKGFSATEGPGVYQIQTVSGLETVAVNLPAAESDTPPLPVDRLEQLGVRLGNMPTRAEMADRERQLRDVELESRQKLWQWLIVIAIGVLGVESFVASRAARKQQSIAEAAA